MVAIDNRCVVNVGHVIGVVAAAPASPPGVKPITRSARQSTNMAEAKSEADAKSAASPAEEADVGWRPNRIVGGIGNHRARPPHPIAAPNEPAPVVIGRPAPRLTGNPRPTPIGLPNPGARTVGSPVRTLPGSPHRAIIGNFGPGTVLVEILCTGVIRVGMAPAAGVHNPAVAVLVPGVPRICQGRG